MGSTLYYGWPTPTGDDYVKNTATYMQNLGNAADQTLGTINGGSLKPVGSNLITTQTFTTASSVAVDNCFSSTYTNYKMVIVYSAASAADIAVNLVGRAGGADVTTANVWYMQSIAGNGTSITGYALSTGRVSALTSAYPTHTAQSVEVYSPFAAANTRYATQFLATTSTGQTYGYCFNGMYGATTSLDGIKLLPSSGTISGTISIYGYRN